MKTIFLLFALGIAAGVRAAAVPRSQALTRNIGDKLVIGDCILVGRGDSEDDDLSSKIATQSPHLEIERAARSQAKNDIYNASRRAKRVLRLQGEDAETANIRKANRAAYVRNRRQQLAQDPKRVQSEKIMKSIYNKSYRDKEATERRALTQALVTGSPSAQLAASRLLAEAKAQKSAKDKHYNQGRKVKRQALTQALVTGSPSTQLAASRLLAEDKAKQSARNKRSYQAKKARQQVLTQALVTGSPSMQLAASHLLAEAKAQKSASDKLYYQGKKAERQALTQAVVTGSPSTQLAASRLLAEAKAQKSASNKRYRLAKKAKQQSPTQAAVTDPVSPSTQTSSEAAFPTANTNKSVAINLQRWKKTARLQAATQPLVAGSAVGSSTWQAVAIQDSEAAHLGAIHQAVQPTHQKECDIDVLQWLVDSYGDC